MQVEKLSSQISIGNYTVREVLMKNRTRVNLEKDLHYRECIARVVLQIFRLTKV